LEDPILASSDELFVGLSNGSPQIAFFGVSGPNAGSVSFTGNCSVTNPTSLNCNVPYTWAEGTSYDLDIARTAKTSSTETWVGTVTNDSSHVSTTVASVTVPASWGDFTSNLSFLAVNYGNVASCAAEPFLKTVWGPLMAETSKGTALVKGAVQSTYVSQCKARTKVITTIGKVTGATIELGI
jgi:hypothetical protein